jgi:2-C-methyl-D-erythritol 2,4-cyclodiphosphate synthase
LAEYRIGAGIDAHALEEGTPLVLGGVRIESPRGLAGYSDGDVIAHALIDAVLGAAGLGDIGELFPASDASLAGISSLLLLGRTLEVVRDGGWELVNADCILVGEEPKIGPHRDEMRALLAQAAGVSVEQITVRATTTDRLGFTGRGEGLAAHAVALLTRD